MRLRSAVVSDRGLIRQTNEDSYLVRRGLYAVCDGMGGARAGEVASEMACRELLSLDPATAGAEELRTVIVEANLNIARRSLEEEGLLGMGTTLTAALATGHSLVLAHIGDSRAYLMRQGTLTQLTDDHSWVGEMVRRGELTAAQAAVHPHRSVITRALGTDETADPDIFEVPVEARDRILLCSDGLTGMVSDPEIAAILARGEDPRTVAGLLVQAALYGGGDDNVTVIVVDIESVEDAPEPDGHSGERAVDLDITADALETEVLTAREAAPNKGAYADAGEDEAGDEILIGPTDRGTVARTRFGRGRLSRGGARGRLGGRVGPILRPASRSGGKAPQNVDPSVTAVLPALAVSQQASAASAGTAVADGTPAGGSGEAATESGSPRGRLRRWTRRKWISVATIVVVCLGIAIGGFAAFNWTVYYVGVSDGGVALYHGLPGSVLGIALSSVIENGTISYSSLAPYLQARVDSHDLTTKEEGQLFLRSLSIKQ